MTRHSGVAANGALLPGEGAGEEGKQAGERVAKRQHLVRGPRVVEERVPGALVHVALVRTADPPHARLERRDAGVDARVVPAVEGNHRAGDPIELLGWRRGAVEDRGPGQLLLARKERREGAAHAETCLLYTSPSPRDRTR